MANGSCSNPLGQLARYPLPRDLPDRPPPKSNVICNNHLYCWPDSCQQVVSSRRSSILLAGGQSSSNRCSSYSPSILTASISKRSQCEKTSSPGSNQPAGAPSRRLGKARLKSSRRVLQEARYVFLASEAVMNVSNSRVDLSLSRLWKGAIGERPGLWKRACSMYPSNP